jgi:hypothetical protein
MRRSICFCEPNRAVAGEVNTWKFHYTTGAKLPTGTLIRFDPMSTGRAIDWEIPTTEVKKEKNTIFAHLESGKAYIMKEVVMPDRFTPAYEFTLSEELDAGDTLTIVMGSTKRQPNTFVKCGTQAQTYAQRRRSFNLYIDTTGKGKFDEPEVFSMDVRGSTLKDIKILTPSFVTRNKRFDVMVRFEDEFGNLTNQAPEETLIELSHEHLRENLNWKIFIPETGFISLPNLYFNEPGIYTIQLKNTKTGETFKSFPIKCFEDSNHRLYWGIIHGESDRYDSTEDVDSCIRHFRDDKAMSYFATSPFESLEETPNETWKKINQTVGEFDEGDRFVTFLGFQWEGEAGREGVRQLIYAKDGKSILRKKDGKYNTLKKIYKSFSPKEILSIPTFTMGKGVHYNFKEFSPEHERVVEIYNAWGSSECTKKEGNLKPIIGKGKKGLQETQEGSIRDALNKNLRFGFVAGGLDDRGVYHEFFECGQEQYPAGMTAIIAPEHNRSSLYDALYNRSCYATTGARIIAGLHLAGFPMGSETNTTDKHGLLYNRHLSGYVAGTDNLQLIEIIRNGKVLVEFKPDGYSYEFTYDDLTPLEKNVLDAKDGKPPFAYYYLRAQQKDGHVAWTSPIWVDYIPGKPVAKKSGKPAKATKAIPENVEISFDTKVDDLEEDDE